MCQTDYQWHFMQFKLEMPGTLQLISATFLKETFQDSQSGGGRVNTHKS